MDRFQPIYDIAGICAARGLSQAVLCPGSRCAPLTLAFTRHQHITCRTISDERSAGYIALGLAQQTERAAILLSTSGTAASNFAPAVAEAFFSNTPLIVFTADRPSEWIGQQDGQAIHQQGLYGRHAKAFYNLPQDPDSADSAWAVNRMVNEAITIAREYPQGPVHINAPFREPLYPERNTIGYSTNIRIIEPVTGESRLTDEQQESILSQWKKFSRVLVVAGQQHHNTELHKLAENASEKHHLPVVGDILSNFHPLESVIRHSDLFLGQCAEDICKSLQPDLLITFGHSVISKSLKLFLRKHAATEHWHIQPAGQAADTFQHLTKVIHTSPEEFFRFMLSMPSRNDFEAQKQSNYQKLWEIEERRAERALKDFFPQGFFGELELVNEILRQLPGDCNLHLANSMSVRYANFIGLNSKQAGTKVYANRGTSGIDGCTSTAVGHSLASDKPNILITGDMAFFYDRNAFWNNYPVPNLHIVVLNNHGSIIFRIIDGPASLPESDEYFVTRQPLTARKLCEEFGFDYLRIDNKRKIRNTIKDFFEFERTTKLIELESDLDKNKELFENLKSQIKKSYET